MLGAAPDGLHRRPHVAARPQQIPSGGEKLLRWNAAGIIDFLWGPLGAIGQHGAPHDVAVAFDHGMGAAELLRLFRIERGVNAAEDHPGAALAAEAAQIIAAAGIAGVDADTDDIPRLQAGGIERLQTLVANDGVAVLRRRGAGQNVQPARCDDTDPKRKLVGVNQMNTHRSDLLALAE